MEFQYLQAMEENNLQVKDLPEDAQTGIENIQDVLKSITMVEARGKKPTEKTLKKLRAMDKWVYYEILDYLQGTDKNEDEMPEDSEEIIEELEEQLEEDTNEERGNGNENEDEEEDFYGLNLPEEQMNKLGLEIEIELTKLFENGQTEISFDQLKRSAKKTADVIFKTYEEGETNGIKTTNFSLIEISEQNFKLSKN